MGLWLGGAVKSSYILATRKRDLMGFSGHIRRTVHIFFFPAIVSAAFLPLISHTVTAIITFCYHESLFFHYVPLFVYRSFFCDEFKVIFLYIIVTYDNSLLF